MTESDSTRVDLAIAAVLLLIVVMGGVDLILDDPESIWTAHVLVEIVLLVSSLGLSVFLLLRVRSARRRLLRVRESLAERQSEVLAWRTEAENALRGLGEQIDRQLRSWGLTPAEREVAMLLLKGFSHQEAADILHKSERTVRQQAVSVYRKSNLRGRTELSAFFLEDLLPPPEESHSAGG